MNGGASSSICQVSASYLPARLAFRAGGPPLAIEKSPEVDRVALQSETLYAVIGVVASSPDLDRVLEGVVDLLTEATHCRACFVYLRDGDRLRLRAASRVCAHLVGRVEMGLDEGLAGWVARHRTPVVIREDERHDPAEQ